MKYLMQVLVWVRIYPHSANEFAPTIAGLISHSSRSYPVDDSA